MHASVFLRVGTQTTVLFRQIVAWSRIVLKIGVLGALMVALTTDRVHASSFLGQLRLEVEAIYAGLSPREFDEMLEVLDLNEVDRLAGVGAGVAYQLAPKLNGVLRGGYLRGSTNHGSIISGYPERPVLVDHEFSISIAPMSVGCMWIAEQGSVALRFEVSGEVLFVRMTHRLFGNAAAGLDSSHGTSDGTIVAGNGALGVDWGVSTRVRVGIRGGYRAGRSRELPLPQDLDGSVVLGPSGAYGCLYVMFAPWLVSK
jgi:hypothetical protein